MFRFLACLALLGCGIAQGAAPAYSAASIVNTGNYTSGPFAPGSILSIFGTNLSTASRAVAPEDIRDNALPLELNNTRVYVDDGATPLFYVSEKQINFMVPATHSTGEFAVRVVRQGVSGPEVTVTLVDAAPALFLDTAGYLIATHADNSVITPDAPARGGEIIVIYLTGLGKTAKTPGRGEIPWYASQILRRDGLSVTVGSATLLAENIYYAGLTPGSAGLYQINLMLPDDPGSNPEIRIALGGMSTPAGVKLATP